MTAATHTTTGHWSVTNGDDLNATVFADSPSEAKRQAKYQNTSETWSVSTKFLNRPEAILRGAKVRLISGFPEIPGHELIFGETVIKGDCLPEADSPLYRVINSEDDLDIYLLDVPSHATFTPPFRPHANSKGQWKCKVLDESRNRASEAIGAVIGDDRRKGRGCE